MHYPILLFFIINNYFPMIGIYYAFTRFNFKGGLFHSPFVGMANFDFLFKSNVLFNLTKNTILYNLAFIIIGNLLQLFTAILLSELIGRAFRKVTQTLMFLPYFVSYVILSVLVYNLFNYEYGFINTFLKSLNILPYDFYNNPKI